MTCYLFTPGNLPDLVRPYSHLWPVSQPPLSVYPPGGQHLTDSVWAPTSVDLETHSAETPDPTPFTSCLSSSAEDHLREYDMDLPALQHAVANFDKLTMETFPDTITLPADGAVHVGPLRPLKEGPRPICVAGPAQQWGAPPSAVLGQITPTWTMSFPIPAVPVSLARLKEVSPPDMSSSSVPSHITPTWTTSLPFPAVPDCQDHGPPGWVTRVSPPDLSFPPPQPVTATVSEPMPSLIAPPAPLLTQPVRGGVRGKRPRRRPARPSRECPPPPGPSCRPPNMAPPPGPSSHPPDMAPPTTLVCVLDMPVPEGDASSEDSDFMDLELVMPYKVPGLLFRRTTDLEPVLVAMPDDGED